MTEVQRVINVRLKPETAALATKALEENETASSFTAKAIAFFALKRTTGKWPRQLPPEYEPRPHGRPRKPKAGE
jgi:hypothetical protein